MTFPTNSPSPEDAPDASSESPKPPQEPSDPSDLSANPDLIPGEKRLPATGLPDTETTDGAQGTDEEVGKGRILVPSISVAGLTGERVIGNRKMAHAPIKMISVKDDRVDSLSKLSRLHYVRLIMPLHVELLKLQNYIKENGLKVVVLFEGRDAAGKGGTIKRFIEHMNPRGCRVVALEKPTAEEREQWHSNATCNTFQRPAKSFFSIEAGHNRAMVECV